MITIKNIVLTLYFMTFARETIHIGVTKEDQACINRLYIDFNMDPNTRYNERRTIPRMAFKFKRYHMFTQYEGEEVPNIAQRYFIHIHDHLQARDGMLTLKPWCDRFMKAKGLDQNEDELKLDCYMKLKIFFKDSNDTTEILKDAYIHLVASRFTRATEREANNYFKHILKYLTHVAQPAIMTTAEICQGKTVGNPRTMNKRKSRTKFKASSSTNPEV